MWALATAAAGAADCACCPRGRHQRQRPGQITSGTPPWPPQLLSFIGHAAHGPMIRGPSAGALPQEARGPCSAATHAPAGPPPRSTPPGSTCDADISAAAVQADELVCVTLSVALTTARVYRRTAKAGASLCGEATHPTPRNPCCSASAPDCLQQNQWALS